MIIKMRDENDKMKFVHKITILRPNMFGHR